MVEVLVGDLFNSKAQTLVNTVNCVGVMGKGIALEFKKRFPDMYEDYVRRCNSKQVKLGKPYLYKSVIPPWILNFPTKDHWRAVAKLDDIINGLNFLEQNYVEWGITSLSVPPLGCGEGQLEWGIVGPTLYRHLRKLSIPVELYAPHGTVHEELQPAFLERSFSKYVVGSNNKSFNRVDPAWVALVSILSHIEQEPHHWPIGRTSFQKIAYFATESGIPTKLQYTRGSFGPYAPNLKGTITRLVNNALIREERLGRMFPVKVGPTYVDAQKNYKVELESWHDTIEKIADLFLRIRTTDQAELAATVHFSAKVLAQKQGNKPSELDVFDDVMSWKKRRKPPLKKSDVALTIRNLGMLGWLDVKSSQDLPLSSETLLEV